jgi:hypothetical protein
MTELDGGGHEELAGTDTPAGGTPNPAAHPRGATDPQTAGSDLRGRYATYDGWTPPADDPLFGGPRTYSFSFDHLAQAESADPPSTAATPIPIGTAATPGTAGVRPDVGEGTDSAAPAGPAEPPDHPATFPMPIASPAASTTSATRPPGRVTGPTTGATGPGPTRHGTASGPGWPGRHERPASRAAATTAGLETGPDGTGGTDGSNGTGGTGGQREGAEEWRVRGWSGEPDGPEGITPFPRVRGFGAPGFRDPDISSPHISPSQASSPHTGSPLTGRYDDPGDDGFDGDEFDEDPGLRSDLPVAARGRPPGGGPAAPDGEREKSAAGDDPARRPRRVLVAVAGAVLVLVAAVAVVTLRGGNSDGGQAAAPRTAATLPPIPKNFLESTSTDSDPIVTDEFFGDASVDVNGRTYRRLATRLDAGCPQLTGDLVTQLAASHCLQVARSLFLSAQRQGERQVLIGATVFDLDTSTTATQGAQVLNQGRGGIMPLPLPTDSVPGAQITGPGGNNSWRSAFSRGHYLVYTQVAYVDGTQGAATDPPLRTAQNDLAVLATEPIGDRAVLGHGPRR